MLVRPLFKLKQNIDDWHASNPKTKEIWLASKIKQFSLAKSTGNDELFWACLCNQNKLLNLEGHLSKGSCINTWLNKLTNHGVSTANWVAVKQITIVTVKKFSGVVHDDLKTFLEANVPTGKKKKKVALGVADPKLGCCHSGVCEHLLWIRWSGAWSTPGNSMSLCEDD